MGLNNGLIDPMNDVGDIIYRDTSNKTVKLAVGTNGQVLKSNGTTVVWANESAGFADPMTTRGDIIYKDSSGNTARLPLGTNGQVLKSDGTDLVWGTDEQGVTSVTGGTGLSSTGGATPELSHDSHTGEVTGSTTLTIANNVIDEANMKISNAPTNDDVLIADSAATGGWKWGAVSSVYEVVDDTTPSLGGNLDLNGKGFILTGQTVGGSDDDLVYLSSANTWSQADADAEATAKGMFGIRINSTTVLTRGIYTTTGLTAGAIYYASTTAGGITTTAPSDTGDIIRIIGYALSSTELFFDPDKTYIEVS